MATIEIHDEIVKLINSFHKNFWFFEINKKTDSHVGVMTFQVHDGIPLRNFGNLTRR